MRAPTATIYYHEATADGNAIVSIHQDYSKQSEDSGKIRQNQCEIPAQNSSESTSSTREILIF